ncbi:MAG: hypothetical protein QNL33_18230 [Akkermansiaceae bacterium]|jgi:hypothetical protein
MKIPILLFLLTAPLLFAEGKVYKLTARASEIDSRTKAHPEIGFLIEDKKGKPQDIQQASVDTRVNSRGQLVIWLMGHNGTLFDKLNSYGLHTIRVHYANKWFSLCCQGRKMSAHCRGEIRLEAATGEDHSKDVDIPKPDGIKERAFQFVKYLAKENPEGKWDQFLNGSKTDLLWEKVILSGASHGSTTAARLAKDTKVARVVALCGPRDQFQTWQGLPSATPENRYFGYSHVLDSGWTGNHYCRSWEMLGLGQFGPIVNVDQSKPPYGNTRRLVTNIDVGGDANRAHGAVTPGSRSHQAKDGSLIHDPVWRYLYTHPVDKVGDPVPPDDSCVVDQQKIK